jgi:hypothetical protein
VRTIRSIIREDVPPDLSGEWSLSSTEADVTDPTMASHILTVLAHIRKRSSGELGALTNHQATWIARLRSAFPDMPASEVWWLTMRYVYYENTNRDTQPLDTYLAFQPWLDLDHAEEWGAAAIGENTPLSELSVETGSLMLHAVLQNTDGFDEEMIYDHINKRIRSRSDQEEGHS